MRGILLYFFLGLGPLSIASEDNAVHPLFQKNTLYTYNYTGEIRTGREDVLDPHFSGFGMQAQLEVYRSADEYVQFNFRNIKIGRGQAEIGRFEQKFIFHFPQKTEETEWVSNLQKPFVVWYRNATFKSFFNPTSDAVNFRKAIVSLFQLRFQPEGENSEDYTIVEESLFGRCPSTYHRSGNNEVVKTRSYETCENPPYLFFSSMMGYQCHLSVQQPIDPLTILDRTHYVLTEDSDINHHRLLSKITAEGLITLAPFTNRGQTFVSDVKQEVILIDFAPDCNTCTQAEYQNFHEVNSLAYDFNQEYSTSLFSKKTYLPTRRSNRLAAEIPTYELFTLLDDLPLKLKRTGKISDTMFKILKLLRQLDYEDIVDLFKKYDTVTTNSPQYDKVKWFLFLEALPFIGTNPSIIFMMHDLIEQNKVNNCTATELLSKFAYHVKEPTYPLFQYILNFTKSTLQNNHYKTRLWRTAWLSIGNLVHRGCLKTFFNPHRRSQPFMTAEECDQCLKILLYEFKIHSDGLGTEYLRAIGNTMLPKAFNFFVDLAISGTPRKRTENIIADKRDEKQLPNSKLRIRNIAIASLIPYMHAKPEEIASIVYDIFHNEDEDDVIRIHAFDILIWSRPTRDNFLHLIPIVNYPKNERLSSWVYHTVCTFAKSKDPARQRLARLSKEILPSLKPPKEYDTLKYSQDKIFTAYNDKYNFGHANQFFIIPSRQTIFPREIYFHESLNFINHKFDIIEMGYIAQDENPFQELSDVFLQKPLGPTTWNAVLNFSKTESKFEWYMKSYSHDVLFDFIAMSPQMYPSGTAKSFDLHKVLYNEVDFHLPNTMGFSVVASVKLFASYNAMGNGSVLSSSDTRSTIEFNSEFSTNIAINSKMYVAGISSEEYGYEVDTFGVVKFPAQCSLDVNSNDQSLSIKHKPSKDVYDLFQFETLPVALFPVEPYKFSSKIAKNPITKKVEIGRDYLGIGLDLHIASNQNDVRGFLSGLLEAFNETSHDQAVENNTLIGQYYAAVRGLLGYAFFNPRGKPFQFVVSVVPSPKYPTKEFHITIRKQTEIFPGWMRSTIQTELVGSGAVLRKWNLDLNRTSSFPKENDLKEFVARMMSPVTKRVAEQLENVKDHYNVSFQHTFNSTVIHDSEILDHIHHTVSMASNFSYFVIAVDSSTYTTDGSVDHDKFYLPHDKFAPWAEETYRWLRKIAQDNFYSTCAVTSTSVSTFNDLEYYPELNFSINTFHTVVRYFLHQDIQVEFHNDSVNAKLRIKLYDSDNRLQRLEFYFGSSIGDSHIFFNDLPLISDEPLGKGMPWTNSFHREMFLVAKYDNWILIEFIEFDLHVFFDKTFILLTAPNSYHGHQCGLCGDTSCESSEKLGDLGVSRH